MTLERSKSQSDSLRPISGTNFFNPEIMFLIGKTAVATDCLALYKNFNVSVLAAVVPSVPSVASTLA